MFGIRSYFARREHRCRVLTLVDGRRRAQCACGWAGEPRVGLAAGEGDAARHRAVEILGNNRRMTG